MRRRRRRRTEEERKKESTIFPFSFFDLCLRPAPPPPLVSDGYTRERLDELLPSLSSPLHPFPTPRLFSLFPLMLSLHPPTPSCASKKVSNSLSLSFRQPTRATQLFKRFSSEFFPTPSSSKSMKS